MNSETIIIKVGMGEGVVAASPQVIISQGIGSCIALTLYDLRLRIGGLAHVMLPHSDQRQQTRDNRPETTDSRPKSNNLISADVDPESVVYGLQSLVYQYADTAVHELLESLFSSGSRAQDIEAKIAGGAKMFPSNNGDYSIGRMNIESVKAVLGAKRIRLAAWDTGGHHGRSVEFHLVSGRMVIRAIGKENKEI